MLLVPGYLRNDMIVQRISSLLSTEKAIFLHSLVLFSTVFNLDIVPP